MRIVILIGNFLVTAPVGIAFIEDDKAAFVVDTGAPYVAGTCAPDDSFHRQRFKVGPASVEFVWGRVGDGVVARLTSDRAVDLPLSFSAGWPDWKSDFSFQGADATGVAADVKPWHFHGSADLTGDGDKRSVHVEGNMRFVAGFGDLKALTAVDGILKKAETRYASLRAKAFGPWGDFLGAMADNMNNSRIYSSDNHMLAHSVSRRWADGKPNNAPYFCWDSFFTAVMADVEDPVGARRTVRAILSRQSPAGSVPNFGHWSFGSARDSVDRSQPPVGSMCVWRMYQRHPSRAFLAEVYPKLVRWHKWWLKYRDGNHNGLLEWGSESKDWQNAQYETGWDDNLHFAGTKMVGTHMNADAVDLSSMWSMDAENLALIADALGKHADARRFRRDHRLMNARINEKLWNAKLGMYCSRLWTAPEQTATVPASSFGKGFSAHYFSDENMTQSVAVADTKKVDFDWDGKSPIAGIGANNWSAQWVGSFTPPANGTYRFSITSDDGCRLYVDHRHLVDYWTIHAPTLKEAEIQLTAGTAVPVVVEYFQHDGGSSLHLSVTRILPGRAKSSFLTRVTPMNFYPLLCGAPDRSRAPKVFRTIFNPAQFGGKWTLPTLAYDDPNYHQQQYWRGDVWGPVNYLVYQGLRRYASPSQRVAYARKGVRLFMRNWISDGFCSENYYSTTGKQGGDPHYTWGALLCMVGLEALEDMGDNKSGVVLRTKSR